MAALDTVSKGRLFSIRNLLFAVTATLMLIVMALAGLQMKNAWDKRERAEDAMSINVLIDDIVQMKMALGAERTATYTAYGFKGAADADFLNLIKTNRRVVADAYNNIQARLKKLPPFDGESYNEQMYKAVNKRFQATEKKLTDQYKAYQDHLSKIDADLTSTGKKEMRGRSATLYMTDLIETAASIRDALEQNYDFGDDRISEVMMLKHQLWLMIEYATRESASLGENIAAHEQISAIKREQGARYGGVGQAAWNQAMAIIHSVSIARPDTTEDALQKRIKAIKDTFFTDFENTRFNLYDLSDEADADENGNYVVNYGMTPMEWVQLSQKSAAPVMAMADYAGKLSRELNENAVSAATGSLWTAGFLLLFVIAMGGAAGIVVLFRVVRPVNALSNTMMVLAQGNLEVEVPNAERNDEMGDMARSVQVFKENAVERQRLETEQREREETERVRQEEAERKQREEEEARRIREQEQEETAREERRQAMLDLADQFEASVMAVVEGVSRSAGEMENAARSMAETADDTSKKSEVVANAAQQASSNAQMVASAAEELSSSVREITGQTNQSSASARDAVSRTENASNDVAELVNAAQKIGDVVKLINDIAEQTNLLALNATIEAARAGDAGKGFAVVASEVKSLANQTAKATQEISEQVDGMQQATNLAVRAMDQIKSIIGEIESTSVSIASAVEEQDASTQEIARNVAEVSTGTEEVTSNIHAVNQGATSTGSAATQVLSAAQLLTQQSDELRGQVESFLKTIRT
ncbi:methyl-accepting chemotaxis protein [Kordiimonas marina]|uniref:methyl-accepting chemotaxis protein n=1 Tax=Kordiimonas marina TaxID=2872312 RepID=UPI001FF6E9A6|nr:methyl-accepting chemotaxis protein [Kordiimonas marina]MCJ9428185.1 methyl-accepting chemotaxis protein [Kordiimonas marina]